jgi:hypothetical protein
MEKNKESGEASASKAVVNQEDVEAMLAKLGRKEDDLDDVIYEEEVQQPEEDTRWMVVGHVHIEAEFSHFWFFKNMRTVWDLAKEVKI